MRKKHADRPETVSEQEAVPAYFSDDDYAVAKSHENYDDLKDAVEGVTESGAKLATIVKTMEHFASTHLEGSDGLEELLAMKLLFFEVYGQVLDGKLAESESKTKEPPSPAAKAKKTIKAVPPSTGNHIDLVGMKYIKLPGGNISLGSSDFPDNPPHKKVIAPFEMSKTVVTQKMYQQITGKNPSHFVPTESTIKAAGITNTDDHPVENVSWFEAVEYCKALTLKATDVDAKIKEKIKDYSPEKYMDFALKNPAAHLYRLPSEWEWEYAAQSEDDDVWQGSNSGNRTHSVNEGKENKHKLKMRGNVWQWCAEIYSETKRGLRGGSWNYDYADRFRSAARNDDGPGLHINDVGFRPVRT